MPQVGLLCHGPKGKSFVSKSSISPLTKSALYVPLRCNDDGNFTLYNHTSSDPVDVYKAKCTKKQYPLLIKQENETTLCSNLGADGRNTSLDSSDYIHSVQIGWNMSAIDPSIGIKEMVSMYF